MFLTSCGYLKYYEGTFEEAQKTSLPGDWKLVDVHEKNSLRIGVYSRENITGATEYVLANRGTQDWSWDGDLDDNIKQPFGESEDVWNSIKYARDFVKKHDGEGLTFVGHSKGGAEAAANAVATNKDAMIFNPATVNLTAYGLKSYTYKGSMTAYIVKGDILHSVSKILSNPIGDVVYLPTQHRINTGSKIVNTYNRLRNHSMASVITGIKEWERGK